MKSHPALLLSIALAAGKKDIFGTISFRNMSCNGYYSLLAMMKKRIHGSQMQSVDENENVVRKLYFSFSLVRMGYVV